MLLQVRCDMCDAYIVLHASLAGIKNIKVEKEDKERIMNASSTLCQKDNEIDDLRLTLEKAGGSFDQLFQVSNNENQPKLL